MVTLRFILTRIYYVWALLPLLTWKKIANLLKAIVFFLLKTERSVASPPILILTLTNRCNYSCVMCLKNETKLRTLIDYANPCDMDFSKLEAFLRKHADYLCLVRLHGGEPLYYQDITRLIDLLNELRVPFNIITNGSLLSDEMSSKLVNTYCVGIGFSLDAAQSDTYEKMRRGGQLSKVTENIVRLADLKNSLHSARPVFSASMCAFSFNVGEMAELVRFCSRCHIPALSVVEGWDYRTDDVKEEHLIHNHIEAAHTAIAEAFHEAKKRGITLRTRFPSLSNMIFKDMPATDAIVKPKDCLNLYSAVWLMPNFDMIGCSSSTFAFGNMTSSDFDAIWNSGNFGYVQSRIAFKENQVPSGCEGCIYTGGFFS